MNTPAVLEFVTASRTIVINWANVAWAESEGQYWSPGKTRLHFSGARTEVVPVPLGEIVANVRSWTAVREKEPV